MSLVFYSDAEAAALLPCSGGYVLQCASGEPLALYDSHDDDDYWIAQAKLMFDDVRNCGHWLAGPWVADRLPLIVRPVTCDERDDIAADGTPWLQREP